MLRRLFVILCLFLLVCATTGCHMTNIRTSETYKLAKLDATGIDTVYLPAKAKIYQATAEDRHITLLMRKNYSDCSIRDDRPHEKFLTLVALNGFGCAYKKENDQLYISTQGEFSFIEGGQRVHIEAIVPSKVKVVPLESLQHRPENFSISSRNAMADQEGQEAEWTRCKEISTKLKSFSPEFSDREIETIVVLDGNENP